MHENKGLETFIHKSKIEKKLSNSKSIQIIPHSKTYEISEKLSFPTAYVNEKALDMGIFPERYSRNANTLSALDQQKLLLSKVAIIGLGGLGGHLLEGLCKLGIGQIKACDGDIFEPSNLNRQRFCQESTLNKNKAQSASGKVLEINPDIEFEYLDKFIDGDKFNSFLNNCDLTIDCLGGLKNRLELQNAASSQNIPLITGAVAGYAGTVATIMPNQKSPTDLFGTSNGAEDVTGTQIPAILTAVGIMISETILILTKKSSPLSSKTLIFDLKSMNFDKITLN